jgi:hypothetical protein
MPLELADEAVAAARVVVGSSDEPVGAEALLQVACTLRSIDVYSAWMGGIPRMTCTALAVQ